MKSIHQDDNIDDMDNDNSVIIIGVIVFIVILLMLIAAFLLLKSKNGGGRKKTKHHAVRHTVKKRATSAAAPAAKTTKKDPVKRAAVNVPKPGKSNKPIPLRGAVDEGIEKYARMTEDYVRSKFGIELKRIDLKKYYSDRHGFDCVDFTYRPASGVMPAQFRTHLNDMDTALSNVSSVDTITFAVDNSTGTYRTTFYLGK